MSLSKLFQIRGGKGWSEFLGGLLEQPSGAFLLHPWAVMDFSVSPGSRVRRSKEESWSVKGSYWALFRENCAYIFVEVADAIICILLMLPFSKVVPLLMVHLHFGAPKSRSKKTAREHPHAPVCVLYVLEHCNDLFFCTSLLQGCY